MTAVTNEIGFCSSCGHDLSCVDNVFYDNDRRSESEIVDSFLSVLVDDEILIRELSLDWILTNLKEKLERKGFYAIERKLGFGQNTFLNWAKGISKPRLSIFLDLIQSLGLSPHSILSNSYRIEQITITKRSKLVFKERKKPIDVAYCEKFIAKLVSFQVQIVPVGTIADRLAVSTRFLYGNYPDQISTILINNKIAQVCKNIKKISFLTKEVYKVVSLLESDGCYPSRERVMETVFNNIGIFDFVLYGRIWRYVVNYKYMFS